MKLLNSLALSLIFINIGVLSSVNAAPNYTLPGDEKTSPGSACNAYYGYQQGSVVAGGNLVYIDGGKNSNKKVWVKCPIFEQKGKGGKSHDFDLQIHLFHPDYRTTKCVLARSRPSSLVASRIVKTATGIGDKIISFSLSSSYDHQISTLYCRLDDGPYSVYHYGATRLIAYHWSEET